MLCPTVGLNDNSSIQYDKGRLFIGVAWQTNKRTCPFLYGNKYEIWYWEEQFEGTVEKSLKIKRRLVVGYKSFSRQ